MKYLTPNSRVHLPGGSVTALARMPMKMNHHLVAPGPRRTSPAGDANVICSSATAQAIPTRNQSKAGPEHQPSFVLLTSTGFLVAMFVALGAIPIVALTASVAADLAHDFTQIFGYAYGHALSAPPEFTVGRDTLYVNGYAYDPTVGPSPLPKVSASPELDTCRRIRAEALFSADHAVSTSEWISRYASVLDKYLGHGVTRYQEGPNSIVTWFDKLPEPLTAYAPTSYKRQIERLRAPFNRLEFLKRSVQSTYDRGGLVVWGTGYEHGYPPEVREEVVRQIEAFRLKVLSGMPDSLLLSERPVYSSTAPPLGKLVLRDVIASEREHLKP